MAYGERREEVLEVGLRYAEEFYLKDEGRSGGDTRLGVAAIS